MTKPSRPLHDMLCAAASRASWHMPGHKGRGPFDASGWMALDTTELPVTDDLYQPAGAIAEAQRLYAEAAGAEAVHPWVAVPRSHVQDPSRKAYPVH